jgi:hypothetical protein
LGLARFLVDAASVMITAAMARMARDAFEMDIVVGSGDGVQ